MNDLKMIWQISWCRKLILIHLLYVFNYFTASIFFRTLIGQFPNESVALDKIFVPSIMLLCTIFLLSNSFKEKFVQKEYLFGIALISIGSIGIVADVIILCGYMTWHLYLLQTISDIMGMIFAYPVLEYFKNTHLINKIVKGETMTAFNQIDNVLGGTVLGILGGIVALSIMNSIKTPLNLLMFTAWFDIFANILYPLAYWITYKTYKNLNCLNKIITQ